MTNGPVASGEKKGLSPLAWVAIGCLGLLVLGGIAATILSVFIVGKVREVASEMEEDPIAATAKLLAAANPDVELVEADKEGRTVTFRDTRTGETFTFGYDDIEQGRVTFSSGGETAELEFEASGDEQGQLTVRSGEGTATFGAGAGAGDLPEWVPVYPGVTPQGSFASRTGEMRAGAFSFETDAGLDVVLDYYTAEIERAGLSIVSRTTTGDGAILIATSPDESRALNVIASKKSGGIEVAVNFNEQN